MTHHFIHLPEGLAIAVIIGTFHFSSDVDEISNQVQVFFILCAPVEFCQSHIMRRTNSISGLFRSCGTIETDQEISGFYCNIQQTGFSGNPVMDSGCRHQVTEIVGFKTQLVVEHFFPAGFLLFNDILCVDIAIRFLCFTDYGDCLIHPGIQFGIFGRSIHGRHGFQSFIKITVVK